MRSYDRAMPEELNRVLADHASDLLLCSSQAPAEILRGERVSGEVEVVGDVMVDVAELLGPRAGRAPRCWSAFGVARRRLRPRHRPSRRQRRRPGPAGRARALLQARAAAGRAPAAPAHARRGWSGGLLAGSSGGSPAPPLGYLDFTALLLQRARRC